MLRVLMVLEDYGEMVFLQTVLKKLGFDVDAIQNPRLFEEGMLTMNPDLLVMTAFGKRVKGLELARGLRRGRSQPRILLLHGAGQAPEADVAIGGWLQSPVGAVDFLNSIADLANIDREVLQDKFHKLRLKEGLADPARVLKSGALAPSSISPEQRRDRYRKFLQEAPPKEHGFAVKKVQELVKTLRHDESPDKQTDLERERRAFVDQLFKKKT